MPDPCRIFPQQTWGAAWGMDRSPQGCPGAVGGIHCWCLILHGSHTPLLLLAMDTPSPSVRAKPLSHPFTDFLYYTLKCHVLSERHMGHSFSCVPLPSGHGLQHRLSAHVSQQPRCPRCLQTLPAPSPTLSLVHFLPQPPG